MFCQSTHGDKLKINIIDPVNKNHLPHFLPGVWLEKYLQQFSVKNCCVQNFKEACIMVPEQTLVQFNHEALGDRNSSIDFSCYSTHVYLSFTYQFSSWPPETQIIIDKNNCLSWFCDAQYLTTKILASSGPELRMTFRFLFHQDHRAKNCKARCKKSSDSIFLAIRHTCFFIIYLSVFFMTARDSDHHRQQLFVLVL